MRIAKVSGFIWQPHVAAERLVCDSATSARQIYQPASTLAFCLPAQCGVN